MEVLPYAKLAALSHSRSYYLLYCVSKSEAHHWLSKARHATANRSPCAFSLLGGIIFLLGFIHPIHYIGYGLGLAGGTYLGLTANRYTRFEHRNYGWYYRTHLWVEVAVLVLFLGRIAYRYAVIAVTTTQFNPAELAQFTKDPVTAGVFFIIVSYYVLYFSYLLRESSKLASSAPAADEVASIGHVEGPCSL